MRDAEGMPAMCITTVAAVLCSLALAVPPAGAETVHVFTQTIVGNALAGTAFNTPKGVAVDGSSGSFTGSVYVADSNNNRIIRFNAAGVFQLMFGTNVNEGSGNPNICTNAGPPTDICKTGVAAFGTPGSTIGAFGPQQPIEVDSSSGPSAGDIYTSNGGTVQKFDPTGHLVASFGTGTPWPGAISVSGGANSMAIDLSGNIYTFSPGDIVRKWNESGTLVATSAASPRASYFQGGLAVDGTGNFFQLNDAGPYSTVQKWTAAGTNLGQIDTPTVSNQGLVFDPTADELFVSFNKFPGAGINAYHFNGSGEVIQAGSPPCAPAPLVGCNPTEVFGTEQMSSDAQSPGIAVNTSNHKVYIADKAANKAYVFSRIDLPKLTNTAASEITRTSVKFKSHIDPDGGGEVITCKFEYGTTREYTSGSVPCVPGTFSSPIDVSATIPADTLTAGTTYHYRLVAGNAAGNRPTADLTFDTLPAVGGLTTGPVNEVKQLTTVMTGSFTGDGVDTSYHFEYGITKAYGQTTPTVDQGTAAGTQEISATATHLVAYTPYHYRLVAENKYGKTVGADQEFLTIAPELPHAEKTYSSSVEQDSAIVNAQVDAGFGLTLYRFEYGTDTTYGAKTLVGGPIDPENPNQIASAELEELTPGTTYHFRVRLTNFSGSTVGADEVFTTPSTPIISSATASSIGQTTATLNAVINPGLSLTTYHFDYGKTAAYGSGTSESASFGPDSAAHAFSTALSGLAPGVVYHFRVVATNGVGVTVGSDRAFTTQPAEGEKPKEEPKKCKKRFVLKHGNCVRRRRPKHHRGHHRHAGGRRG